MSRTNLAKSTDAVLDYTMIQAVPDELPPPDDKSSNRLVRDYQRIEQTIHYLMNNRMQQPELAEVAAEVGLSEFHFQRLFSRWAGISPKKFLQYVTLADAKQRLQNSASVLDATFDVGLSGPSRLHDLFLNLQHVTPGEFKTRGKGLTFYFAFHVTPFGECMTVENERGLTGLSFVIDGDQGAALNEQKKGWHEATWIADRSAGKAAVERIFSLGQPAQKTAPISVLMRGTAFQVRVWEALLKIPAGHTSTYGNLSVKIGYGKSVARALGTACGANRIAVLIPCHRVIRDSGVINGYRWGMERKQALLAYEAAKLGPMDTVV